MHRRFFNAMYVFTVAIQAIVSLISPIAIGTLIAWLLNTRANVGTWIYVVCILLGVGSGLIGMVRFVLAAMAGVERLENERAQMRRRNTKDEGRRNEEENGKE